MGISFTNWEPSSETHTAVTVRVRIHCANILEAWCAPEFLDDVSKYMLLDLYSRQARTFRSTLNPLKRGNQSRAHFFGCVRCKIKSKGCSTLLSPGDVTHKRQWVTRKSASCFLPVHQSSLTSISNVASSSLCPAAPACTIVRILVLPSSQICSNHSVRYTRMRPSLSRFVVFGIPRAPCYVVRIFALDGQFASSIQTFETYAVTDDLHVCTRPSTGWFRRYPRIQPILMSDRGIYSVVMCSMVYINVLRQGAERITLRIFWLPNGGSSPGRWKAKYFSIWEDGHCLFTCWHVVQVSECGRTVHASFSYVHQWYWDLVNTTLRCASVLCRCGSIVFLKLLAYNGIVLPPKTHLLCL